MDVVSASNLGQPRLEMTRRKKVLLGGTDYQVGPLPSVMKRVVSDRIRCTKCTQSVARYPGFEWKATVTYMHFRNFYPDQDKLLTQAASVRTSAA